MTDKLTQYHDTYVSNLMDCLAKRHLHSADMPEGIRVKNGLDEWMIDLRYVPAPDKAQVKVYHTNLFYKGTRKSCMPDMHLQFSEEMTADELAQYIECHAQKYGI